MQVKRGLTRIGIFVGACAAVFVAFVSWDSVATAKRRLDYARQEYTTAIAGVERIRAWTEDDLTEKLDELYSDIGGRIREKSPKGSFTELADVELGRKTVGVLPKFTEDMRTEVLSQTTPETRDILPHLVELHPVDTPELRAKFLQAIQTQAESEETVEQASVDGRSAAVSDAYITLVIFTLGTFLLVVAVWIGVLSAGGWIIAGFRT